ncbi:hypothetical protein LTR17_018480 [Elasticomyces elasticus]|nr:hypothetical protein LTR17_018480 [Elasticomyces elasticus]
MSGWNITITDPDQNESFSGMLIGLELGTTIEDGKNSRAGIQRMTGTLKYMDLEVIQMCVGNGQPNLEDTTSTTSCDEFQSVYDFAHLLGKPRVTHKGPRKLWREEGFCDLGRDEDCLDGLTPDLKTWLLRTGENKISWMWTSIGAIWEGEGHWDESERLLPAAWRWRAVHIGEKHPSMLTTEPSLASTYLDQGRWKEAGRWR